MVFHKRKAFWYPLIASMVFFTDIALYFHLNGSVGNSANAQEYKPPVIPLPAEEVPATRETIPSVETSAQGLSHSLALSKSRENDFASIKSRSQHLSEFEILNLASNALDIKAIPNARFESVFMLIHNDHALSVLKKIIESPIPKNLSSPELDFERSVRAQAIEGRSRSSEVQDNLSDEKNIEN